MDELAAPDSSVDGVGGAAGDATCFRVVGVGGVDDGEGVGVSVSDVMPMGNLRTGVGDDNCAE